MKVPYSYLLDQFANPDAILADIKSLVSTGDYTLGKKLDEFEMKFANYMGTNFAIGVGTGTDALRLSLLALGVRAGDEVITQANTFYSTAAAIATIGATPVFVDVSDDAVMNVDAVEAAITEKTKAIIPVHLNGCPVHMETLLQIANQYKLPVVEDACQAIGASINGQRVGSFGTTGCFSLHPLKNINVWGDGGVIVTNDEALRNRLHLLRNNGLKNRDECMEFAYNCRLDTLHAIVGLHVLNTIDWIVQRRVENGMWYDDRFSTLQQVTIPPRREGVVNVHHNYIVYVQRRDELVQYLRENGVEAKIHYPIPLHLQQASKHLGYKEGDFPMSEQQAATIMSLPVHQHVSSPQREFVATLIEKFYDKSTVR